MKHYIQRIDSDNLKQDFKTAMQEELKDIKSETEKFLGLLRGQRLNVNKAIGIIHQ
ncbi:hypothetical protein [Staphylococcus aureus]|uniref:hypothetical protein n=1 Tax=Staphylococcus aureus TaxID=1280 RepID=UPI000A4793CE